MPRDVELAQLPSDLLVKVLAFLPVPELAKTSCLSRAFKSYSYCDALFVPKLAALGLDEEGRPLKAIERIPDKAAGAGLKSGAKANGARAGSPAIKDPAGANAAKAAQKRPEAPKQNRDKTSVFGSDTSKNPSLLDGLLDGGPGDGLPPALMDFPSLFQKKASETAFNAGTGKPREVFRKEYVECMDLYRPFRSETGGIDALASKFEDLPERAKVANRLKLFASLPFLGDAALILPRIMTGLQEFSNNLIASFSEASDVQDYDRMKEISQASFVLDGGAACVQLFLSKSRFSPFSSVCCSDAGGFLQIRFSTTPN